MSKKGKKRANLETPKVAPKIMPLIKIGYPRNLVVFFGLIFIVSHYKLNLFRLTEVNYDQ